MGKFENAKKPERIKDRAIYVQFLRRPIANKITKSSCRLVLLSFPLYRFNIFRSKFLRRIERRMEAPRKLKDVSIPRLDKNWVDNYIQAQETLNDKKNIRDESLLVECLPISVYQRLAALWNLNPLKTPRARGNQCRLENIEAENERIDEFMKSVERDIGCPSDISEDLHVNVCSQESVEKESHSDSERENVYLKFQKRNENFFQRRRINLHKKTKTVTKVIIKQFLDWYQSLGGNDSETLIDEATLHELFQIGFDMPEVKSLIIGIRELPTVPGSLATLRNEHKHATRYALRQLLKQDIKKENTPVKLFAFGSMLPKENPPLRYKPPRNEVRKTWMECERVPSDLDTMKTIWGGLEKLRSTIAFSNWLKDHPEISPPAYLQQKGLLNINYEEWNLMYKGFEMDVDTVEVVASDIKIIQDKTLGADQGLSEIGSLKYDSYNSLL